MRRVAFVCCIIVCAVTAGCLPVKFPSAPAGQGAPPALTGEVGPYWHQVSAEVVPADALAYYAALKVLTSEELVLEYQRLLKALDSTDNRLANVQLVMLASLPGQPFVDGNQAVKALAAARQDSDFHRRLGDLFILINDQLVSCEKTISQDQECANALRVARKKAKTQGGELVACREERDDLAFKLKKLQDIERGLIDRGRKK